MPAFFFGFARDEFRRCGRRICSHRRLDRARDRRRDNLGWLGSIRQIRSRHGRLYLNGCEGGFGPVLDDQFTER